MTGMPDMAGMAGMPGGGSRSVADLAAPASLLPGGHIRRFDLTTTSHAVDLPGIGRVDAWTFRSSTAAITAAGPLLRVQQGDRIVVRLRNALDVPTSIHWHGIDVPNSRDGVPGLTQDALRPGGEMTYTFDADQAGTYWYHSHQDSLNQVARGLFGAVVVDPPGGIPEQVDRVVMVHSWNAGTVSLDQDGASSAPAQPGQRVRVRLVNTDADAMTVTVTGAGFTVAALDGHDLHGASDLTATSVLVPAAGRVNLTYTQPVGHAVRVDAAATNGTATYRTGNAPDPVPTPATTSFDLTTYGTPDTQPGAITLASPFTKRFTARITSRITFYDGQLTFANAINDKLYPDGDMFMVDAGDLVEVTIENRSFASHPMHLHGHTFTVLARDGRPLTGSPVRLDTLQVDPGVAYTIAFHADNPGLWMFHCHNLQHAAGGMSLMIGYSGVTTPYLDGPTTGNIAN